MSDLVVRHARRDDLDALLGPYAQLNQGDAPAPRERLAAILDTILQSTHFATCAFSDSEKTGFVARPPKA